MLTRDDILVASKEQVSADLGSETSNSVVILGLRQGVYYELKDVGARFWSLIQEPRSLDDILRTIQSEYDVDAERCERDLMALVADLIRYGLVSLDHSQDHAQ